MSDVMEIVNALPDNWVALLGLTILLLYRFFDKHTGQITRKPKDEVK